VHKFTLRPRLAFSYIGSVTARGTPAAGVSQTLRRGTRNGITELSQRAPPIFGWAAITLDFGPHSIVLHCVFLSYAGVVSVFFLQRTAFNYNSVLKIVHRPRVRLLCANKYF